MRARHFGTFALVCLALGFAGCVSLKHTPEARFFVLLPLAEPPEGAAPPSEGGVVGLLRIVVPEYLERPQVVSWVAPGELKIDEFLRWAEPIDAGVSRTLAENLQTLLPKARIIRAPWPFSTKLRCRLRVELQRFGPQTNGEVQLDGRFALLPVSGERPLVARPVSLRRGPLPTAAGGGPDVGAEIEALSRLVADLASQIVVALEELPPPSDES
jgi:uncharacterized lipoprotein YmbA